MSYNEYHEVLRPLAAIPQSPKLKEYFRILANEARRLYHDYIKSRKADASEIAAFPLQRSREQETFHKVCQLYFPGLDYEEAAFVVFGAAPLHRDDAWAGEVFLSVAIPFVVGETFELSAVSVSGMGTESTAGLHPYTLTVGEGDAFMLDPVSWHTATPKQYNNQPFALLQIVVSREALLNHPNPQFNTF